MSQSIALITGASSGLGQEYVRQLSRDPKVQEIWAIARRKDRLEALSTLAACPVRAIPLDLTRQESLDTLRDLLAQEQPDYKSRKKEILAEIEAEGRELLAKMGLADRAGHYPHQLSGGQQQRVAIARALALHPDILCFDEPTSALDPELTGEVLKVIRSLAEQKTTMIIVTHEMAFARDVADQVIFMDGGVIVEQGDARQVIENPQQERTRQFLSRYSEN